MGLSQVVLATDALVVGESLRSFPLFPDRFQPIFQCYMYTFFFFKYT